MLLVESDLAASPLRGLTPQAGYCAYDPAPPIAAPDPLGKRRGRSDVPVGHLTVGCGLGQLEGTAPAAPVCGKLTYSLVTSGYGAKTPFQINLNGKDIKVDNTWGTKKQPITLQDKNRLQVNWNIVKPNTRGGKVSAYSHKVSLGLMYGNRISTIFDLDTAVYPGKRELAYNFSAPPAGNIACAKETYTLQFRGSYLQVVEWTVAVNGKYYLYHLNGDIDRHKTDLRPFLKKGENKVTLSWRTIVGKGSGVLKDAASLSSDASGSVKQLLSVDASLKPGQQGSQSVTITVK